MPNAPTRDRVDPQEIETRPQRRPPWIRVKMDLSGDYQEVNRILKDESLHTVCEEAMCPNQSECWGAGTATFLLLGDVCTRSCKFCDIKHGKPGLLDWEEPQRTARSIQKMDLNHAVVTSVNRDERRDGGAPIFSMLIHRTRQLQPGCSIEVLIPDFKGSMEALQIVMDAGPDILNHNIETVPELFREIQPQSDYQNSRATLVNAKRLDPGVLTKSGLMVGLGENIQQVKRTIRDLGSWDVDILTIGQYLQKEFALDLGFKWVESAPLVRSSYHAAEQVRELSDRFQVSVTS